MLNWPIRYCAVNNAAKCIAIVGRTGIAYYNSYYLLQCLWKLYSNEAQEKYFVVVTCPSWYRHEQLQRSNGAQEKNFLALLVSI